MRIAVDAMGGDRAPQAVVEGVVAAAREQPELEGGHSITLVGPASRLQELLQQGGAGANTGLEIAQVDAPDVIGMDEKHPVEAVRRRSQASLVVAARLVGQQQADALVTMGSTGAAAAAALLHIGRISGVERAAVAVVLPLFAGPVVLVDAGANVDCRPHHLLEFGALGVAFATGLLGVDRPRVGLLNIGEEPGKGNEVTKAAFALLQQGLPGFTGNVEGKDLFAGAVDVVVCDGFVGNVLLKTLEGFAGALFDQFRQIARHGARNLAGGFLLRPALAGLARRFDYRRYGGAFLLGVRGVVVIGHGRSDATAVASAIRVATQGVQGDVVGRMTRAIARLKGLPDQQDNTTSHIEGQEVTTDG